MVYTSDVRVFCDVKKRGGILIAYANGCHSELHLFNGIFSKAIIKHSETAAVIETFNASDIKT